MRHYIYLYTYMYIDYVDAYDAYMLYMMYVTYHNVCILYIYSSNVFKGHLIHLDIFIPITEMTSLCCVFCVPAFVTYFQIQL